MLIGATMMATAIVSSANIAINWGTINQPIWGPAGVGTPVPDGSIAQLIWSPTGVLPANNLEINALDPLSPYFPGEIVIGTGFASGGIGLVTPSVINQLGQPALVSGFVYTRAFNTGAPGIGDFWGVGTVLGNLTDMSVPGASPNQLDAGGTITAWQIVPEPSVLAFLGIAGAMIALRRNRK